MNEQCVSCRKPTVYDTDTHIQNRIGYIQGAGQLCKFCYETIYNKKSYVLRLENMDESKFIETSVRYDYVNQIKGVYPYEEYYIDNDPSIEDLDEEKFDKLIQNINISEILPKLSKCNIYYIIFVQKI